jgi:hypothetical protein
MRRFRRAPRGMLWVALSVYALAVGVRLWWLFAVMSPFDSIQSDMAGYVDRAERLLWHIPLPADPRILTLFPPGRHWILAAEFWVLGRHSRTAFAIWYALLGAVPAPCVAALTWRFVPRLRAAGLVGAIVALWFPQVAFTAFFSTELWFSAVIVVHAWLTTRERARVPGKLAAGMAAATAFALRPQFLLAWAIDVAAQGVRLAWQRGVLAAVRGLLWVVLPLVAMATVTSVRFYRLTGQPGLISESSLNRLWADTDICQVQSTWVTPTGETWNYWFSPPSKPPHTPSCEVHFDGYIQDRVILDRIRRDRMRGESFATWLHRKIGNVELLAMGNLPWPERNYQQPPWRLWLQEIYATGLLDLVLPLAAVGIMLARRDRAKVIIVANLVAVVLAAAFFYGEARYNVPYVPFEVLLAVAGCYEMGTHVRTVVSHIIKGRKRRRGPLADPPRLG